MNENYQVKVLQRYYRKTTAHPEGSVTHYGDCDFFNIKICTCGLHADLRRARTDFLAEHYPLLEEELSDYEKVRAELMGHTKPSKKH